MLDRMNNERICVDIPEFEQLGLTKTERRLIRLYRLLSEHEQMQFRRLSELLATTPEESVGN